MPKSRFDNSAPVSELRLSVIMSPSAISVRSTVAVSAATLAALKLQSSIVRASKRRIVSPYFSAILSRVLLLSLFAFVAKLFS